MTLTLDPLLSGLRFPEGPRWHEGRLWFSDMHDQRVVAVGLDGAAETIVETPHHCSGLGWLPDGRLLVVSMEDRKLLRLDPSGLREAADLSRVARFHCNDMVVDRRGRAYVGNFGFDFLGQAQPAPADLALVHPDGRVEVAAAGLSFPNGTVLTPDGGTLVVGESFAGCLTAFDVAEDGRLSGRREWARLAPAIPDGICLDAEGGIWVASPVGHQVLRVLEGGRVTHRVPVGNEAFACMLGGPERRHLLVCTATTPDPKQSHVREGRIEVVEVEVPGAGLP